jgi:3-oxoacyl-[acyl-carrier-protein] synthase III
MRNSTILGTGFYVPPKVVTNDDLAKIMDTTDEWIQERSGIKQRHYVEDGVGPSDLAKEASEQAIADAGMTCDDIQMIVFATNNADFAVPGSGCILQSKMPFGTIPAFDVRGACSGFVYSMAIADQFIKTGFYDRILVVGAEVYSLGLDFSKKGRNFTVLFGDGAGAVVMGPAEGDGQGLLGFTLHAQGEHYDKLWMPAPYGGKLGRITHEMIDNGEHFPRMDGQFIFRNAIPRFCEAINEVLESTGHKIEDLDLFIPHQANGRITSMVARKMGLPDEKVVSNIHKYGNTTAATIPICIHEAREEGRLKKGDLLCAAAFGAGLSWGSFLMRWTL